jgi:hypothetical protein
MVAGDLFEGLVDPPQRLGDDPEHPEDEYPEGSDYGQKKSGNYHMYQGLVLAASIQRYAGGGAKIRNLWEFVAL